jgi:hypothetical protein
MYVIHTIQYITFNAMNVRMYVCMYTDVTTNFLQFDSLG